MTDDELLELVERARSNVSAIVQVALSHRDPHDEQVHAFNRELRRLLEAGFDVGEWLIPESLLRHWYGQKRLPSGEYVPLLRVTGEEFLQRANPAMEYLNREVAKRRREGASRVDVQDASSSELEPVDPAEVWVIYGRDEEFRRAIFDLLRKAGLRPIEFDAAVTRSGSGSPVVLDVVLREIGRAPAIVSLLTPDDYAELREELRPEPKDDEAKDDEASKDAGYQPRPNVILETGMALAALRHRTILVTRGSLRAISDIEGLHDVRWDGSTKKRNQLLSRLHAMGCPVDRSGSDWLDEVAD